MPWTAWTPGQREWGGTAAHDTQHRADRKSTRLNSSHANISYAVFCLKKKKLTLFVLFYEYYLRHTHIHTTHTPLLHSILLFTLSYLSTTILHTPPTPPPFTLTLLSHPS